MNFFYAITLLGVLEIMLQIDATDACSCPPEHAQTAYCSSDYVIVAQILRKSNRTQNGNNVYKIAVKKEYKINSRAKKMLAQGKIFTFPEENLCGLQLEVNQLYAIAGNDVHVTFCNFVRKYSDLSKIEKRGLAGIYRKGCVCKIKQCYAGDCNNSFVTGQGICNWTPWDECETQYGVCVPTRGHLVSGTQEKCHWRRSLPYQECKVNNQQK